MLDSERAVIPLCWTASLREVCFVHLGKYGDIMIMLPAFKRVAEETGKPPICIVSQEYASIFDGVSYVRPWIVNLHWWRGVGEARKMAQKYGFNPIVIKWWDEPDAVAPGTLENGKPITLTIHGKQIRIAESEWDSFQSSQWRWAGFTMEQMHSWPLEFDKRDHIRESALKLKYLKRGKRTLLVNLTQNGTSPFRQAFQAKSLAYQADVEIVDLSAIRAGRIYDLLGLYDSADGLVTSDTATLHLAAASKIPYIAFINDGGAGSVPKGNCVLSIRYSQFQNRMGEYIETVRKLGRGNA